MSRGVCAGSARWGVVLFLFVASSAQAAVFPVVRSDVDDVTEEGTLRWAIAQAGSSNEANLISIDGSLIISVDGGFPVGGFTTPLTIEGNGAIITTPNRTAAFGFRIDRPNVTIRDLTIGGFSEDGIQIAGDDCFVFGCTITDCGEAGILIAETLSFSADGCQIGGPLLADRNFIYGNGALSVSQGHGIHLLRVDGTTILNNFIGFGPDGGLGKGTPIGNAGNGIRVEDSPNTKIGETNAGNYISGNGGAGIFLTGADTDSTLIYSNTIGLAADGVSPIANNGGIATTASNRQDTVIVGIPGKGNVISGNNGTGIAMDLVDNVTIQSNYVGLSEFGTIAVPNSGSGIVIATNSTNALIGGGQPDEGNVVSGNAGSLSFNAGIRVVSGSSNATIQGNVVGFSADLLFAMGNGSTGILIQADNALVGGPGANEPNLVAFNTGAGIAVTSGADFARLTQNKIFANTGGGIVIEAGSNNDITPPVIEDVDRDAGEIVGTVAVDGLVEVFADGGGQGQFFVGEVESFLGFWLLSTDLAAFAGLDFTATVTQPEGLILPTKFRTSAFGAELVIPDDGPLQCSIQSDFGQPVELSEDSRTCYGSNAISGLRGHEKIDAPSGGIGIVRWWGVASADPNEPCDASLLDYNITFFDTGESEDEPGAVVSEQTVQATLLATELSTFGLTVNRYEAVLPAPVFLPGETGWVSIYVPVTEGCRFFWCTSGVGDNEAQLFNNGTQQFDTITDDLSICTSPGGGGEGEGEGTLEGEGEGVMEGEGEGEGEGMTEGEGEGQPDGEGSSEGEGQAEGEGQGEGEGALEGEGEGTPEGEGEGEPFECGGLIPATNLGFEEGAPFQPPPGWVRDVSNPSDATVSVCNSTCGTTPIEGNNSLALQINLLPAYASTSLDFDLRPAETITFSYGAIVRNHDAARETTLTTLVNGEPISELNLNTLDGDSVFEISGIASGMLFGEQKGSGMVTFEVRLESAESGGTFDLVFVDNFSFSSTCPSTSARNLLDNWLDTDSDGDGFVDFSEFSTAFALPQEIFDALDTNGDNKLSIAEVQRQVADGKPLHNADQNADGVVTLSELLRLVQFYNAGGYTCTEDPDASEDGFQIDTAKGADPDCPPHASDYAPADGIVSLSELLRLIQFYNLQTITACPGQSEDGFCG